MLDLVRTTNVRSLYVLDDLSPIDSLVLEGEFRRATEVPTYLKNPSREYRYVGAGGDSIESVAKAARALTVPLFEYAAIDIEGFELDVETMITQRLEALIDSASLGIDESSIPAVSACEVEAIFREAFAGREGKVLHVLDGLPGLRRGLVFGVLDYAGVLIKRGTEYGMLVDMGRITFARLRSSS